MVELLIHVFVAGPHGISIVCILAQKASTVLEGLDPSLDPAYNGVLLVRGGELEVSAEILAWMAAWSSGILAAGFFLHEGRGVPASSVKGARPCSRFGGATSL